MIAGIVGPEMLLGQKVVDGDEGLLYLGERLAADYGQWARIPFLVGFLAVTFSSLLGVWNGVSLLFVDWWRTCRLPADAAPETVDAYDHKMGEHSTPFRLHMLWLTFSPMVLLFLDKPFQLTIAYGVLGALFMPFLSGTLLVLLNSKKLMPARHRSRWLSNGVLTMCLLLFAVLAVQKIAGYVA